MKILREPLLHFMVAGALIYVVAQHFDGSADRYRIDAGPAQRARIESTYREQYGVPPTPQQVQYLLDQYVRSEILFREGKSLGLDRDDEIVRRRVIQKVEFLNESAATATEPAGAELQQFFAAHQRRYLVPAAVSFTHIYFSTDQRGNEAAQARAETVLASLNRGGSPTPSGDLFAEGASFDALSADNAIAVFGESPFSQALASAPQDAWAGPFRSAFGWHLLRVSRRDSATVASFGSVRDRVRADYVADARERANAEEFRRLASKYQIVTDKSPT